MRRLAIALFSVAALAALQQARAEEPKAKAAPAAATAAIRSAIDSYVATFNRHDAAALAALWTADAVHVDRDSGERIVGRAEIESDFKEIFTNAHDLTLTVELQDVRLVRPDVAEVDGLAAVTGSGAAAERSNFSSLLVQENGNWRFASMDESDVPEPATAYDALQQLEWLVGEWVDSPSAPRVHGNIRWGAGRAFLIWSYTVAAERDVADGGDQGTVVIGWDPRSHQVRSWTFDSDGSFGDGLWSRNGDKWTIQSTKTLADGRAGSGTHFLTRVDADTVSVLLVGEQIEGEPTPAAGAANLVRVKTEGAPAPPSGEKPH